MDAGTNITLSTSGAGTKIGTGSNQKLAFWNATPVVQPTSSITGITPSSPGAGNVIKTDDTFNGYTVGKIVAALQQVGILA